MRLLHTSDWHLGRSFHRVGLLDAQAQALAHLVDVVRSEKVDAVVVAGDVYDRALPAVDVVQVLDEALAALAATGASIILTSGNHDSARRLGFGGRVMAAGGVYVRTSVAELSRPVELTDRHGPVAVYGLPYLEPALVGEELGVTGRRDHPGVLTAAMDRVRADLAARPTGTRSVVAAHAFVTGGAPSDSERDLAVGGVGAVSPSVFDGLDYVALGHLHGRQTVREDIRYSGSPLPYSFSEAGHTKGSWLVELGAEGLERVDPVDAPVHRPLRVLRGELAQLLADPALTDAEAAFCQVTLTDADRPREPMTALRDRFPHTLVLGFDPVGGGRVASAYTDRLQGVDDLDVCCGFLDHVRSRPADAAERELLARALRETADGDVDAAITLPTSADSAVRAVRPRRRAS